MTQKQLQEETEQEFKEKLHLRGMDSLDDDVVEFFKSFLNSAIQKAVEETWKNLRDWAKENAVITPDQKPELSEEEMDGYNLALHHLTTFLNLQGEII